MLMLLVCLQVQFIQQWKSSVQASQDQSQAAPTPPVSTLPLPTSPAATCLSPQELLQTLEKARSGNRGLDLPVPTRGVASPKTSLSLGQERTPEASASQVSMQTTTSSTAKELQLEDACRGLQKQVWVA